MDTPNPAVPSTAQHRPAGFGKRNERLENVDQSGAYPRATYVMDGSNGKTYSREASPSEIVFWLAITTLQRDLAEVREHLDTARWAEIAERDKREAQARDLEASRAVVEAARVQLSRCGVCRVNLRAPLAALDALGEPNERG